MLPIAIPKELVNDDAYVVAALLADPGQIVAKGQPLAELETSKAAFTLVSPADGFFRPDFAAGDTVKVGGVFGHIADSPAPPPQTATAERTDGLGAKPSAPPDEPDSRFSRAAWELFRASGLPLDAFARLSLVKKSDVENALAGSAGATGIAAPDADAVVLLGGGGHCRECVDIIELEGKLRIFGIIDTYAKPGTLIAGHPVLGDNSYLEKLRRSGMPNLVLAYGISGSQADRGRHFRELLALGHAFPAIVHPKASVNRQASIGRGVQVMGGGLIGSLARIGDACIINSNAVVSHDCEIGTNVHIAPGALLAGGVKVGEDSVVGMGATIYMRVRIGSGAIVYNGANVFADVPDGATIRGEWHGGGSF